MAICSLAHPFSMPVYLPATAVVLVSQAMGDAGDTRETPAIDVCKGLMEEGAKLRIYDPQVTFKQIKQDLSLDPFEWDAPSHTIQKKCASPDCATCSTRPCLV